MKELIVINPFCPEENKKERLEKIIRHSTEGCFCRLLTTVEEVETTDLRNKRILFTISLGKSGINLSWYSIMKYLRLNHNALEGSVGGVILDGNCEFYTKSAGRSLVFTANRAGCTFPGRPLVEGTRTLKNYNIHSTRIAKISHTVLDTSKVEESYYRTLINKYTQNLKSVSALTTGVYTCSVCSCLHFIEQIKKQDYYPNPDLKYLNTQEAILIRNFVANNSEISLSSLNNNIGSIRRFLQWCKANGYIKFDEIFFDYLAQFEEPNDYHGKSIPDDDLKKISNEFIKLCKEDESYLVYYAIFIILLETEFRVSQVCSLTTSALQPSLKNDQFYLYSNTKTSNGKKIQQPICASTKSILSKVTELTEPLRNNAVQESSKNLIFLYTHSNGAITPMNVAHFRIEFRKVCSKAGVADYNSRHLRDTHMTKAFEFILKTGKSDLEMGLLSKHSVIDTTKLHYIEIELLESIYQVTLGNRDVTQDSHILGQLPAELSDKDTEVECGCGHCSAATCNITGNMSCLMCKHFVTTPSHKPYFIKMIDNCDELLSQTQIQHEREDIILIKTLFTSWLREICIVEEQNNDRKSIN